MKRNEVASTIDENDMDLDISIKQKVKLPNKKVVKIRKEISLPKNWIEIIQEYHVGTVSSYMVDAIKDKLKEDGLI